MLDATTTMTMIVKHNKYDYVDCDGNPCAELFEDDEEETARIIESKKRANELDEYYAGLIERITHVPTSVRMEEEENTRLCNRKRSAVHISPDAVMDVEEPKVVEYDEAAIYVRMWSNMLHNREMAMTTVLSHDVFVHILKFTTLVTMARLRCLSRLHMELVDRIIMTYRPVSTRVSSLYIVATILSDPCPELVAMMRESLVDLRIIVRCGTASLGIGRSIANMFDIDGSHKVYTHHLKTLTLNVRDADDLRFFFRIFCVPSVSLVVHRCKDPRSNDRFATKVDLAVIEKCLAENSRKMASYQLIDDPGAVSFNSLVSFEFQ